MRFACQSCGKAYNLPEERIADKSNVKLKCRVCGAIVEVKRQGELVAIVLDESEYKRGRVSEAPAPLTTLTPEDDADDGATISIPEAALNERGALQLGLPGSSVSLQGLQSGSVPVPPAPPTGFSPSSLPPPPPLSRPEPGWSRLEPASHAPPSHAPPLPSPLPPLSPPPPLEMELGAQGMLNGNNAASGHFFAGTNGADVADVTEERSPRPAAPAVMSILPNVTASSGLTGSGLAGSGLTGSGLTGSGSLNNGLAANGMAPLPEELPPLVERDDTMKKMLAAFLTGVLIDRLIAGLFF